MVARRHFLPDIFLLLLVSALLQPALATEASKIPMTASRWQTTGDVAFEQDKAKQDILMIKKGYAQLKHSYFGNRTIEFDVKFVGSRLKGIAFHQHGETADALFGDALGQCGWHSSDWLCHDVGQQLSAQLRHRGHEGEGLGHNASRHAMA